MTANTSSPKNYNILALRGASISDMEYVETFGLDPKLAGTPELNEAMLDLMMSDNVANGIDEAEAKKIRTREAREIKKLLAMNGMLK